MFVKVRELAWALSNIGLRRTFSVILVRFFDAIFDWRYGTDTVRRIELDDLQLDSENKERGTRYQPTGTRQFKQLVDIYAFPKDGVFIDYGCGKGRVLLMAAAYGFKRVVGVEFSGELCRIARQNVENFSQRNSGLPEVQVVEADASRYDLRGDETVLYFYCPFDADLMRNAIGRVVQSLRSHPRKTWLVYNLPRHREVVDQCEEFKNIGEHLFGGYECIVYLHEPAGKQGA